MSMYRLCLCMCMLVCSGYVEYVHEVCIVCVECNCAHVWCVVGVWSQLPNENGLALLERGGGGGGGGGPEN